MISDEYLKLLKEMVEQDPDWGSSGHIHAKTVLRACKRLKCQTVLDYGCGSQSLKAAIAGPSLTVFGYDPARDIDQRQQVDLVCCIDVLEHIEQDRITQVLDDIRGLARIAVFIVISLRSAHATLPDGRNAHLTVRTKEQWHSLIDKRFRAVGVMPSRSDEMILMCMR